MSRLVIRHTAYNAIGIIAPTIAALIAIPTLYDQLGPDRFGILTLVWAVVAYFGIFDLGLGRALTLQLSVIFAHDQAERANELTRTALAALAGLGLLSGLVLVGSGALITANVGAAIHPSELVGTVWAMAVALPFIVFTSGVRGVLEAKSAFGVLNAIRVPMGSLNFLLPVAIVLFIEPSLDAIAWSLTASRVLGLALHWVFMARALPGLLSSWQMRIVWLRILFKNGGWMTVSNIVSPLMSYLDRFIVGILLPAAAVAYYATPQEMILKAYVIPGALTAVLFPRFAGDRIGWRALYERSLLGAGLVTIPACILGLVLAHPLLSLWLGADFADQSFRAAQILFVGVAFGAMSSIPYTLLQATGRANFTAISHVCQVPAFIACSYLFTQRWGIEGAAVAWSLRLAIDAIILFIAARALPMKSIIGSEEGAKTP